MRLTVGCILALIAISVCALGGEPAATGSAFADVLDAFAPLSVLHRSYADFLFYGTDIVIPDRLALSCDEAGYALATLHLDLIPQTGSAIVNTLPRLARLRADFAGFCGDHSQMLASISASEVPDIVQYSEASDQGVFSDIYRLQGELQALFEAYVDELSEPEDMWEFAVAFSLKSLQASSPVDSIDVGLRAILYGSEEAVSAPPFVSEDASMAILKLLTFVDVPLDDAMLEEALHWVQFIYQYVMQRP